MDPTHGTSMAYRDVLPLDSPWSFLPITSTSSLPVMHADVHIVTREEQSGKPQALQVHASIAPHEHTSSDTSIVDPDLSADSDMNSVLCMPSDNTNTDSFSIALNPQGSVGEMNWIRNINFDSSLSSCDAESYELDDNELDSAEFDVSDTADPDSTDHVMSPDIDMPITRVQLINYNLQGGQGSSTESNESVAYTNLSNIQLEESGKTARHVTMKARARSRKVQTGTGQATEGTTDAISCVESTLDPRLTTMQDGRIAETLTNAQLQLDDVHATIVSLTHEVNVAIGVTGEHAVGNPKQHDKLCCDADRDSVHGLVESYEEELHVPVDAGHAENCQSSERSARERVEMIMKNDNDELLDLTETLSVETERNTEPRDLPEHTETDGLLREQLEGFKAELAAVQLQCNALLQTVIHAHENSVQTAKQHEEQVRKFEELLSQEKDTNSKLKVDLRTQMDTTEFFAKRSHVLLDALKSAQMQRIEFVQNMVGVKAETESIMKSYEDELSSLKDALNHEETNNAELLFQLQNVQVKSNRKLSKCGGACAYDESADVIDGNCTTPQERLHQKSRCVLADRSLTKSNAIARQAQIILQLLDEEQTKSRNLKGDLSHTKDQADDLSKLMEALNERLGDAHMGCIASRNDLSDTSDYRRQNTVSLLRAHNAGLTSEKDQLNIENRRKKVTFAAEKRTCATQTDEMFALRQECELRVVDDVSILARNTSEWCDSCRQCQCACMNDRTQNVRMLEDSLEDTELGERIRPTRTDALLEIELSRRGDDLAMLGRMLDDKEEQTHDLNAQLAVTRSRTERIVEHYEEQLDDFEHELTVTRKNLLMLQRTKAACEEELDSISGQLSLKTDKNSSMQATIDEMTAHKYAMQSTIDKMSMHEAKLHKRDFEQNDEMKATMDTMSANEANLQKQVAFAERKNEDTKAQIYKMAINESKLQKQINCTDEKLHEMVGNLRTMEHSLDDAVHEGHRYQCTVGDLKQQLETNRAALEEQVRTATKSTRAMSELQEKCDALRQSKQQLHMQYTADLRERGSTELDVKLNMKSLQDTIRHLKQEKMNAMASHDDDINHLKCECIDKQKDADAEIKGLRRQLKKAVGNTNHMEKRKDVQIKQLSHTVDKAKTIVKQLKREQAVCLEDCKRKVKVLQKYVDGQKNHSCGDYGEGNFHAGIVNDGADLMRQVTSMLKRAQTIEDRLMEADARG